MKVSHCYYEVILVPMSLSLTIGYHIFLWHTFKDKNRPGTNRKKWVFNIMQDQEKKGMLGVQSLRNTLMTSIMSCSIAVVLNVALAAAANNAYNGSRLLRSSPVFGLQTGPAIALKYSFSSLFLLSSHVCSSMGVAQLVEAGFLLNAPPHEAWSQTSPDSELAQVTVERGYLLAVTGNRLLFIAVPFLFWMLGPAALMLSSLGLVWLLYGMDFPSVGSG